MANSKIFVDNYLPALLGQAWMLVSSEFHAIVEEKGLSVLEWRVLSTLAGNGSMGITELAQKTVSKQPTITRVLQRLEQQGHVVRHSNYNGSDKRITLVSVTSSGMSLVDGLLIAAQQHEEAVLAPLGLRKSKVIKQVLQELIERYSLENANTTYKSTSDNNHKKKKLGSGNGFSETKE
ncbi:TPA: MarR family transcriptional regulator [Providencia rettgeri]|uniref:MarR family winged helix-turn-helix transcriptional regulator n=1 Tax=Providencia TaxID=586 RepID=UPI001BA294AA|nr:MULTISPECIES: MarR family transcriptional regulator [Providencia]EMB5787471.1 MarR family transcriptional regulator [Providencia rettgeri]MDK7746094.1 MarR family transcriptional regulator [Providencia rettgeri]MDK7758540.1 MarR family transcriptional regulator [Providencia rettgeri]HBC7430207.1 MarR family transcriptional regulator [Providencia rettgeri]